MPFGVVGSTDLATAAQNDLFNLQVIEYPDEQSAMDAIDRGEIYGALDTTASPAELVVVPLDQRHLAPGHHRQLRGGSQGRR